MDYIPKGIIFMMRNTRSGFPGGFGTIHTLGLVPVLKFLPQNIAHMQVETVMTGKCAGSLAHGSDYKKVLSGKLWSEMVTCTVSAI